MNILIKPKKNRYIIYAALIGLLGAVGMNISLLNTNADKVINQIEYKSSFAQLLAVFKVSISNKGGPQIYYQLVAAGIFIVFLIVFSYKFSIREIISAAVLSVIYGMCMWIGTVFSHEESWEYFLRNKYVIA